MKYNINMGSFFSTSLDSLIFQPPTGYFNSNNLKYIKSKNGNKIAYLEILSSKKSNKYIVWSHGNAMVIHQLESYFKYLSNLLNINIIAYDYQGYGLSEGICNEQNCYDDLEMVVSYLVNKRKIDEKNIYLIGQSLGTGVVVNFVSLFDWNTPVLLISPYKSMARVVTDEYAYMSAYIAYPIDQFITINKLSTVTCPIKIIHGLDDEVINVRHGQEIFDELPNKLLKPIWMPNTGHNDILTKLTYEMFEDLFIHS